MLLDSRRPTSVRGSSAATDSRLPFTVLIPDSRSAPVEIHDHSVSLRMAVVEKDAVQSLDGGWDAPGAYVLLGPICADRTFNVYVGKAPAGLRKRLLQHDRQKQWSRALLIQRSDYNGLSSAQAGWLEGDLYDLFSSAAWARLTNAQKPGDDTVPSYDLRILESFLDPITRVLRLLGYDTDSADELVFVEPVLPVSPVAAPVPDGEKEDESFGAQAEDELGDFGDAMPEGDDEITTLLSLQEGGVAPVVLSSLDVAADTPETIAELPSVRTRKKKYYGGVKLVQLIEAGLLTPGEHLFSLSGVHSAEAELLEDGSVLYDGVEYATSSSAGKVATTRETNGWDFWAVQRNGSLVPLFDIRKDYIGSHNSI